MSGRRDLLSELVCTWQYVSNRPHPTSLGCVASLVEGSVGPTFPRTMRTGALVIVEKFVMLERKYELCPDRRKITSNI